MIMSVHPILQSAPRATSSHLKNGRRIPFVTVVTDLGEAHPWWFNKGLDRLFVPTEVMRDQGVHLGVDPEKIKVCGLPLRQMFWNVDASDERKMALRDDLELDRGRPVVLVMGGGDGMGKLQETAMSFVKLLDTKVDEFSSKAVQFSSSLVLLYCLTSSL
jgi:1,2-diacylglycerol 3-beta-galactosyltransferase